MASRGLATRSHHGQRQLLMPREATTNFFDALWAAIVSACAKREAEVARSCGWPLLGRRERLEREIIFSERKREDWAEVREGQGKLEPWTAAPPCRSLAGQNGRDGRGNSGEKEREGEEVSKGHVFSAYLGLFQFFFLFFFKIWW